MSLVLALALTLLALGLLCIRGAVGAWRARRRGVGAIAFLLALLFLLQAVVAALILVGTRGYRALTREVVAATVVTETIGPRRFRADFAFPDGERRSFLVHGDQLYVDAHILKWHPLANVLGLHTEYELDRVAGRYERLQDERARDRTIYALGREKPFDFFHLARAIPLFAPLVDAEYGSASFVPVEQGAVFELRVSTSGLLFRRLP